MSRPRKEKSVRPYLGAAFALLIILAALFPRTYLFGDVLLPAGLLFNYPPWSEYTEFADDGIPAADNYLTIEAFLMFNMFYAATEFALDQGEWPLWNPLEFGGMPLLANYQSAVLYPPRLMHAVMDPYLATTFYVILKLWLCGFNAYLCARVFRLRPLTAMIPAVAWMLSGYNTTWAYWADPDVAAWLPLQLASAEFLARGWARRGGALMALSSTLMLLAGHPESAFTMSAGTGLYFFARVVTLKGGVGRAIAAAAIAWAVAIAITAPQTIPFLEYLPESHTFASRGMETDEDLHFFPGSAWMALFVPRFFGTNMDGNFWSAEAENQNYIIMAYAGIAVWIFALVGVPAVFARRRSMAIGLLTPFALSMALATGASSLAFIRELPLVESIWGCWYFGFPLFVLALLAGFGVEFVQERVHFRQAWPPAMAALVVVVLLGIGIYSFYQPVLQSEGVQTFVGWQLLVAGLVMLLSLGMLLSMTRTKERRWHMLVLIALIAGDLVWAARNVHPSAPGKLVLFETNLTNVLKQEPARVHASAAGIPSGLLQAYGIEQLWGYDGIMPERWMRFLTADTALVERMAGVRYVLTKPDSEPKGLPLDGVGLHERADALPRAFLSRAVVRVADADAVFARMNEPDFDPESEVLTTATLEKHLTPSEGDLGEARLVERTTTSVIVDVEANAACAVVLSDAYYPGWTAHVDQDPVQLFPAYHAFRAIIVPKGAHRVEFRYDPPSFRIGLITSVAAMLLSIAASAWLMARRSRP